MEKARTRTFQRWQGGGYRFLQVVVAQPVRQDNSIDPDRVYTSKEIKALKEERGTDPSAPPAIRKRTLLGIEYEPDSDLRDTEQVPLLEEGGINAFFAREVLPYAPDAWIDQSKTQIGYEISFTRYFYKPKPMRSIAEILADLQALQTESEGLLDKIIGGVA